MKLLLVHLFVLLAYSCLMTQASCIRDRNHDHLPRVSCTSMGLSDIPPDIDVTTQVLNFTNNQFSSLSWTSFKDFPKLIEVDLSQNQVNMLEQSSELFLPNLKILRLAGNQLEWLLPKAFAAAIHLMEIYLQGNKLRTLNATTFSGLAQLEILVLSQNHIQSLPLLLLSSIPSISLKTFDLEDNQLSVLPNNFFDSKHEIPYVYLSKNLWHCNCEIGYLSTWLDDQAANVYIHTGPNSIINDPESVTCHSPSQLKDQPIIELKEEEYCSPFTEAVTQSSSLLRPGGDILRVSALTTYTYSQPNLWTTSVPVPDPLLTIQSTSDKSSRPWSHTVTSSGFYETVTELYTWFFFNSSKTYRNYTKTTKEWYSWFFNETNYTMASEHRYEMITRNWFSWIYDAITAVSVTVTGLERRVTDMMKTSSINPTTMPTLTRSVTPTIHHLSGSPTSSAEFGYEIKRRESRVGTEPAGVYCWWLFLGYLCLCIFLGLWVCAASLWLLYAYLRIYLPLFRSVREKSKLLSLADQSREDKEQATVNRAGNISLPMGGVQAVFRSVLLVSVGDEGEDSGGALKSLETGEMNAGAAGQRSGTWKEMDSAIIKSQRETQVSEKRGATQDEVFRKTLYRVISQEGEMSGWADMQESWKHERKPSRNWKKRYSLILREEEVEREQEEKEKGRRQSESRAESVGHEWVVGEWEWKAQEGERGTPATAMDDHWSLMPLIARSAGFLPTNSDNTSETYL